MTNYNYITKSSGGGDLYGQLQKSNIQFYYVIDGVSGKNNPQEAASTLNKYLHQLFDTCKITDAISFFEYLSFCHLLCKNEGFTLKSAAAGILFIDSVVYTFNVGDVRVYGINNNQIHQLTKDDSVFQEMLDAGEVNEESYLYNEQKSFITQCIGGKQIPDFHIEIIPQQYQAFIITTDGIHACFLHRHLQYMINEANNPKEFLELLYSRSDSPDNTDDRTILLLYQ